MARVAVCIAAYKRPVGLARLLESLTRLTFPSHPNTDMRIVVVDTPAEDGSSSRDIIEEARVRSPWKILYEREPRRGLSIARNKGVEAAGEVDYCAFVDDDEEADPLWMDELLSVQQQYRADVVHGSVIAKYHDGVPPWIREGGFFQRPFYETGDNVPFPDTGNVLVDRATLRKLGGPFDTSFNFSGGEDIHLFARIRNLGGRIVAARDAIVYEYIVPQRATAKVILRRAYNGGTVIADVERKTSSSRIWILKRTIKGVGSIGWGCLCLPVSLFSGRAAAVKALCRVCRGYGSLVGLAGVKFDEWGRHTYGE